MTDAYSLAAYGSMVADRVRTNAYAEALRRTVRPGSIVVEIGTALGVFAVLACQFGAARVFAIEMDDAIQVAKKIATANGCGDRIEFIQEISTNVTLPVRADVIVSDLRGTLPFFEKSIPSIVDARRRFLAPGGALIPQKDTIWAAVAELPEQYANIVDPWDRNVLGQDLTAARQLAVNNVDQVVLTPESLLATPHLWATLDYATVESPDFNGELQWTVQRSGVGHGVVAWFDTVLAEGTGFSNAPGTPVAVYHSIFFPWAQPVSLTTGETVSVTLEAKLIDKRYIWRWMTRISESAASGRPAIRFEQSQLNGAMLSLARLHKGASDHVPQLSKEGRLHRRTLELMDGKTSLEEIARLLTAEFPQCFPHPQQALSYAGNVSRQFSL